MQNDKYISYKELLKMLVFRHNTIADSAGRMREEISSIIKVVRTMPVADVLLIPEGGIGEVSDGYHTFNSLYHQRLILTAALVKAHKEIAWKSWKHEDGEPCFGGEWFIVGLATPEGDYTYHCEAEHWDLFDCVELPCGRPWDGHTDKDVERLLSIPATPQQNLHPVVNAKWEQVSYKAPKYACTNCKHLYNNREYKHCPFCGASIQGVITCRGLVNLSQ